MSISDVPVRSTLADLCGSVSPYVEVRHFLEGLRRGAFFSDEVGRYVA